MVKFAQPTRDDMAFLGLLEVSQLLPNLPETSLRLHPSRDPAGHETDAVNSRAFQEYYGWKLLLRADLEAQERVQYDLHFAGAHRGFMASRSPDAGRFLSPALPRIPQPPQASSPRCHAVEEPAEEPSASASSVGSSANFEVEPEDNNDVSSGALDAFLDTCLVQHASLGALLRPHIRKEASQVIITLLSETFDPRKTL